MIKKLFPWFFLLFAVSLIVPNVAFGAEESDDSNGNNAFLQFEEVKLPKRMYAGLRQQITVKIRNTGTTSLNHNEVFLSYHWRNEQQDVVQWDGIRTELPFSLAPDESVETSILVQSPYSSGNFILELDAVIEGVTWFTWSGQTNGFSQPVAILSKVAEIEQLDIPPFMKPNEKYTALVEVSNVSVKPIGGESFHLSYHWKDQYGKIVQWDGIRTPISQTIEPSQSLILEAIIWTPDKPGRYILEWDLVHEGLAWMSSVDPENASPVDLRIFPSYFFFMSYLLLIAIVVLLIVLFKRLENRLPAFRLAKQAIDLIGAHFKNHSDVFVFVLLLSFKFFYFERITGFEIGTNGTVLTLCLLAAIGGLIGFVKPSRSRVVFFLAADLVISIVVLADLVYWRYFGDVLSMSILVQSNQAADITASIVELITIKDILIVVLISLVVWSGILFIIKRIGKISKRVAPIVPVLLIVASVGLSFNAITNLKEENKTLNVFGTLFLNQWVVERLGLAGYHIFDSYVYLRDSGFEVSEEQLKRIHESFKWNTLTESKTTSKFGVGKGKNLIVIQMEGLQEFVVGLSVGGQELTPNLNRLKKESFYFSNYFDQTNQGRTSDGEFTSLVSLYPLPSGSVYFKYTFNNFETSLPNVLKNHGYTTMSGHAYRGDFWNRYKVHPQLGFEISKFQSDLPEGEVVGMGLADHEFYSAMVDEMKKIKQPFFAFLISLSNHHPYNSMPEKYKSLRLGDIDGTMLGNYFQSVHYSDMALGTLIDRLKKEGLYENSVIAIYGDHDAGLDSNELLGFLGLENNTYNKMMLDKVPFIIHVPGIAGEEIPAIGGHLDMTPTLLHLMGIQPQKKFYYGNNLFSSNDKKIVAFPSGSFVNNVFLFYTTGGAFERGTCYLLETGEVAALGACRQDFETAMMEMDFSLQVLKGDLLGTQIADEKNVSFEISNDNWWNHRLVAHAMGATKEGVIYTNSLEAFEENYAKGLRLFEVDLVLTKEDILVARHDWDDSRSVYMEQDVFLGGEPWPYDLFMQTKINNQYTPLSFLDIVNLMRNYPDIYIITDTKYIDPEIVKRQFTAIVNDTNGDEALLKRIIPQYYSPEMYRVVNEIYPFEHSIYTLYMTMDSDDLVIDFLNQNSIEVVTMATSRINQIFMEKLLEQNKIVFVHTINDKELAEELLGLGVFGLYTDILQPETFQ